MQWRFARGALKSPSSASAASPTSRARGCRGAPAPRAGGGLRRGRRLGRAKLDDEVVELATWDVLRVAPAVMRSFEAGPDGMDVICIGGRRPARGDTEKDEAFWRS